MRELLLVRMHHRRSLTGEARRAAPQPALLHALSVEQPVAQLAHELVQLGPGGVDELGPGAAQHGPAEPEWQAGGHRGRERTGEAEEPAHGEEELLLSARHDGGGGAGGGGHHHNAPASTSGRRGDRGKRQVPAHTCAGSMATRARFTARRFEFSLKTKHETVMRAPAADSSCFHSNLTAERGLWSRGTFFSLKPAL